jgi:DNA mismatch repair protein MutH
LKRAAAPVSIEALLARARVLTGRTVGEVAATVGARLPASTTHGKGFVGTLAEAALGATAGSKSEPDFQALGVELKTIPLDATGTPRESTFVCSVPLAEIAELEFTESPLWKKLERVLFVPVEAEGPLEARRFGASFLFEPTEDERQALRADWDLLAGLLATGDVESIDATLGEAVQIRPKGRSSADRTLVALGDEGLAATPPMGFYLRARFTALVVRARLGLVG